MYDQSSADTHSSWRTHFNYPKQTWKYSPVPLPSFPTQRRVMTFLVSASALTFLTPEQPDSSDLHLSPPTHFLSLSHAFSYHSYSLSTLFPFIYISHMCTQSFPLTHVNTADLCTDPNLFFVVTQFHMTVRYVFPASDSTNTNPRQQHWCQKKRWRCSFSANHGYCMLQLWILSVKFSFLSCDIDVLMVWSG